MAEYIEREEYCEKHCPHSNEYCDKPSCPIWKAPAAENVAETAVEQPAGGACKAKTKRRIRCSLGCVFHDDSSVKYSP